MSFKVVMARLFWAAVVIGGLVGLWVTATIYSGEVAALSAPAYIPLPEEEVFKQAGVECIRPAAASSGCVQPTIAREVTTGSAIEDYPNYKAAKAEQLLLNIQLSKVRDPHESEYWEKEIRPRAETFEIAVAIMLSAVGILVLLYAGRAFVTWYSARRGEGGTQAAETFKGVGDVVQAVKSQATSRKMRSAEREYRTLKNLHDNGLISDEKFDKRKNELRSILEDAPLH